MNRELYRVTISTRLFAAVESTGGEGADAGTKGEDRCRRERGVMRLDVL